MPKSDLPVIIVGAGPAGSSLAIRLRMCGMRVMLIERTKFPRQKLCGEFISPECLTHFDELGVLDEMLAAGGDRIYETVFYERGGRSARVPTRWFGSGSFALSLSRAEMDRILLGRARFLGAEVMEETAVTNLIIENDIVKGIVAKNKGQTFEKAADIVIDATGRGRSLARMAEKKLVGTVNERPRFVAFKAHLSKLEMPHGVCEMYGFRDGYAGLSFVENGLANLCFIVKASAINADSTADAVFDRIKIENARARQTLSRAERIEEWLAVSIPRFGFSTALEVNGLYCVGDSAAFIDPFTGSGMLMAIEGASEMVRLIGAHRDDNTMLRSAYLDAFRHRFKSRLLISGLIRHVAYRPILSTTAVRLLSVSKTLRAMLARQTRSAGNPTGG